MHSIYWGIMAINAPLVAVRERWGLKGVATISVYFWCDATAIYKATETMGVHQDDNGLDEL